MISSQFSKIFCCACIKKGDPKTAPFGLVLVSRLNREAAYLDIAVVRQCGDYCSRHTQSA